MNLKIETNYMKENPCYQKGAKRKPIGMQLHTIGAAQGSAKVIRDSMNQRGYQAAVNAIVDSETEGKVIETLPDWMRSWADGGYGNEFLYTFEIGESDYMKYTPNSAEYMVTNQELFRKDILRGYWNAVAFCAKKCKENGWNPLKKLENGLYTISSHDEGRRAGLSTAHVDPTHIWEKLGLTMDGFRRDVYKAMQEMGALGEQQEGERPDLKKRWYRVQCGAFEKEENASAFCNVLKKQGIEAYVRLNGKWYQVQCGAFEEEENAKKLQKKLQKLGYSSFVSVAETE